MAEVLLAFEEPVLSRNGSVYIARACGGETDDGRWQGWIEFEAIGGEETFRTPRETTQPNRTDTEYWATGLTPVYLEGALERALRPARVTQVEEPDKPAFDGPRPSSEEAPGAHGGAVLDPFAVYRNGEAHLRRQLAALDPWHLVNIVTHYRLSEIPDEDLNAMPSSELIALIVLGVREGVDVER